ncbi:DUF3016 domain-containing protein [Oxalobacteraceae bacterium]|nr:DUF3016 domain-containing protein [Oxalobacteraceae bacterium]
MSVIRQTMLAAALALLASGAAMAQVSVDFVKPESFSDVPFSTVQREQLQKDLAAHFEQLGKRLPAGQSLKLAVLDVDLAGRMKPVRRATEDIRVLNGGADWPRMVLRYSLEQDGKVLRSGEAKLANMNYQMGINRYGDSEPLRYEKQMIDEWFGKEFAAPKVAGKSQ